MDATFEKITVIKGRFMTYYSLLVDDNELNEFEDFNKRMRTNDDALESLRYINAQLITMCTSLSLPKDFIKKENNGHQIPHEYPGWMYKRFKKNGHMGARLYCKFLFPNVIVLFNGGLKTTDAAQDCKNCRDYFEQMERFSSAIDKAKKKDFKVSRLGIQHDPGYVLEIK